MKNYLRPIFGVQLLALCFLGLTAQAALANDADSLARTYTRLLDVHMKADAKSSYLKEHPIYQKNRRAYCFDSLRDLSKDLDIIWTLNASDESLQKNEDLKPLIGLIDERGALLRNFCLGKWDAKLKRIPKLKDVTKYLDLLNERVAKTVAAIEPQVFANEKVLNDAKKCTAPETAQALPLDVPAEDVSTEEPSFPDAKITIESIKQVDGQIDGNEAEPAKNDGDSSLGFDGIQMPQFEKMPKKEEEAARARAIY